MFDILLTGDSHTAALRKGQIAIEAEGRWPEQVRLSIRPLGGGHLTCEPFFVDRGDHAEITGRGLSKAAATAADGRRSGGNDLRLVGPAAFRAPLAAPPPGRASRRPRWREESREHLYRAACCNDWCLRISAMSLDLLALLKRLGKRVFVVEAPYPFDHHPALRKTSRDLVRFVDRVYRDLIRRELTLLAVPIVAVPGPVRRRRFHAGRLCTAR